ncbi:MAG: hypothetical protein FJ297_14505 [Planctomycetes bacterium]|nr:hypothetical protein [Planctomycetota bacterium]
MRSRGIITITLGLAAACALAVGAVRADTEDLGNGFRHHGVATPVSGHRGLVATVDGEGHKVVLAWLNDHRGAYELLLVDIDTGKSDEFPLPFPAGDHPFASILSSGNKLYTHFNSHFVEFDPARRAFTFHARTAPQMAMSMTEADDGTIWSATYPQSGVVSFRPDTREFKDYGHLYAQDWPQYPRSIAVDDSGWVYFGIGSAMSQVVALDPRSGKATPLVSEDQRAHGFGQVERDLDGRVYAEFAGGSREFHRLYRGAAVAIGARGTARPKPLIAGDQGLFHSTFPDGCRVVSLDLAERRLVVEGPANGERKAIPFDYASEGAHIMGLAAAPDGTICGGTSFPMRCFRYDPRADAWHHRDGHSQWNTVARGADRFFVGGYGGGVLLEWDVRKPWVDTEPDKADSNPRRLTQSAPTINRPHDLLVHPDGKTLVLAGTPGYGFTGGGLLFWDRESGKGDLRTHDQILPEHSTMSLAALAGGDLVGGSTISPGTGGQTKAAVAELYLLDMATKTVRWHEAMIPEAREYTDLCVDPNQLVYGFTDRGRFFVLDPAERKIVHQRETRSEFGPTASQQGPRVFVTGPRGEIFILFTRGIARVEPGTFQISLLAQSPVSINAGGDWLDGRVYFIHGSHVYSYEIPR